MPALVLIASWGVRFK